MKHQTRDDQPQRSTGGQSAAALTEHQSLRGHFGRTDGSGPRIGVVEFFRLGQHDLVESVLEDLRALGVKDLRTSISWAEWHTPEGEDWYTWLLPRLASEVNVMPCLLYTPPSQGVAPRTSSPPRNPKAYADFLDVLITNYGKYFEWIELWNEPNNASKWDRTLDPQWYVFCEMIGGAAYWARQRGKKTLLAGMGPVDPHWLRLMFQRGVMQYIDAVGLQGFPGNSEATWEGWPTNIRRVQKVLDQHDCNAEIWVTETGYSTWRHDEYAQLQSFVRAIETDVDRVYWLSARDLNPEFATIDGFHSDDRQYHFGMHRIDRTPKLLARLWASGGLESVCEAAAPRKNPRRRRTKAARPVVITGGAGFIGTNLADRLLSQGHQVLLYDNLSRPGVERNLRWLVDQHGSQVQYEIADIRNQYSLRRAVRSASQVFHFAAQVAVTTSLANPTYDFEVNAFGTLNLLEALRESDNPASVVFPSTNKVYGGLDDITLTQSSGKYLPADSELCEVGISERRPLDLHSPYGCSKGAADQYIIDYTRTFGLPAVVFRMSCIYGPHQMGTEDQGWVAHFLIQALEGRPITLYGDGMQVRDVLYAEDLVNAFLLAQENMDRLSGQAFNIGGGPDNAISLIELIDMIADIDGHRPEYEFDGWRPGDQRYYVSDTSKFQKATGWAPRVGAVDGVQRLYDWLVAARRAEIGPTPRPKKRARTRRRMVAGEAAQ